MTNARCVRSLALRGSVALALLLSACTDQDVLSPEAAPADADQPYQSRLIEVSDAPAQAGSRPSLSTASTATDAVELIQNGSFESGFNGWSASAAGGTSSSWNLAGAGARYWTTFEPSAPQHGSRVAMNTFDGAAGAEFRLWQTVVIPTSTTATLTWKHRIQWEFGAGSFASRPRTFEVQIRSAANHAVLATVYSFATPTQSEALRGNTGWQSGSADLSAFAGSPILVTFRESIPEYYTGPAQFEIDEISLLAVNSDDSPPEIEPLVTGTPGDDGWYRSDVSLAWSVNDEESELAAVTGCEDALVSEDTAGESFTCSASSQGGDASETVVIKRDATAPEIAFAGNADTYTVDEQVAITCTAVDATSGLRSVDCPGASGDAYTFALGEHSLSATATDHAGNQATGTASFRVEVTSASLCTLVERWVNKTGIAKSMCSQLDNGATRAFVNHVRAQSGKSLSAAHADILIRLAESL